MPSPFAPPERALGETRVDLHHLLEDLRDAYPGSLEETILTEIVANALDSGASAVAFATDPAAATLTVTDDGRGMRRAELRRYHDLATTTKVRGTGIGFAGVGIKLGLLACAEVFTESRRGPSHVATTWHLASRHRAPWRWVPPAGLLPGAGTAVRLRLSNPLSPLLDPGFVTATLRHHFRPLLDAAFSPILRDRYPKGIRFSIDGRVFEAEPPTPDRAPLVVRLARRRKPSALGYLRRATGPLPDAERGLAVSTLGKVIKQGWDWLGVTPAATDRVAGAIEAPDLAACLTLNKADFLRSGSRGALHLAYRRAIQEVVTACLAEWGDVPEPDRAVRPRTLRPLERDLETVLVDLARDFPLLSSLVNHRAGGQRRLPLGRPDGQSGGAALGELVTGVAASALDRTPEPDIGPVREPAPAEPGAGSPARPPAAPPGGVPLPAGRGPRRPGRYALSIQFESRPEDPALGRLVETTVWVNDSHPAFRRARAARAEGYHVALSVAIALAPLAVAPADTLAFVTRFLAYWGETSEPPSARKLRRKQRR